MAVATGSTTVSLLNTAGISPNQYGSQVALDYPNQSVMFPLVRRYMIEKGNTLYIPKVGTRSVTARTRGTDDNNAITFSTLDDTAASFTKRTTYDAIQWDYMVNNDMSPERLRIWLEAERSQAAAAIANDFDSQTLGLYSSASDSVGSSATDVTYDLIVEAIKKLRVANAPGPYFIVLPETQWDHLAKIDELTRFDVRGEAGAIDRQAFRVHGVNIFTTGNVPTAGGAAHGLAFSGEGIATAIRDFIMVKEWDEPNNTSLRVLLWADWAYANTYSDYIVDFQTTDA